MAVGTAVVARTLDARSSAFWCRPRAWAGAGTGLRARVGEGSGLRVAKTRGTEWPRHGDPHARGNIVSAGLAGLYYTYLYPSGYQLLALPTPFWRAGICRVSS